MDNKFVKVPNNEISELAENAEQEIIVLTTKDEYAQTIKKRKERTFYFVVFALIQIAVFSVLFVVFTQNDIHYRVIRELENNLTGKNIFLNGTFLGDTDFGYFIGEGTFEYKSGAVYNGQWSGNHIEGVGSLKTPSEGIYKGEFIKSQKSGTGIFTWDDGTVYDGEWKNDQMNGQGIYTSFDNVKYIGTFSQNQFQNGKCTFFNETGTYIVEYKDFEIDKLNVTFPDGTTYVGSCDGKSITGTGTMMFPNGDVFTGRYDNGMREGNGVYDWKNGDSYDGNWSKDGMTGSGKYSFANGSCAQGTFENNSFTDGSYTVSNSFGDYTFTINDSKATEVEMNLKSGTIYSGDMINGKLTGTAQITYHNGDKYSGNVLNGYKSGQGTYTWKSGASFDGNWVEDKMEGQGTYYYPSNTTGYKLIGMFNKGVPNGECQYYVSNNEAYKTDWINGKCVKIYE